jgi:hypothetical protein
MSIPGGESRDFRGGVYELDIVESRTWKNIMSTHGFDGGIIEGEYA